MFKTRSLNQISYYYLGLLMALITTVVSLALMIETIIIFAKPIAMPDQNAITPQEQTLNKVLELLDNQVLEQ